MLMFAAPLKIGKVQLNNNLLLAPMAGYGDIAFRRLCADYGAGLTYTEMISCKGLNYDNNRTVTMLRTAPNEKPVAIQLFGSEPEAFKRTAADKRIDKFDIIDVNMGCPVPKVTKSGEGSALMKTPELAYKIISALKQNSDKPVTVKFRLGFTDSDVNAVEFACGAEAAGADLVTVHGRTASQMYRGRADWSYAEEISKLLKIPVIGNGDADSLESCRQRLVSGVDGIMIGRGALGHPDIFSDLLGGEGNVLLDIILRHIRYLQEYFDERYTVTSMRKHLAYYLKGVPNLKEFKNAVNYIDDVNELKQRLEVALKDYSLGGEFSS